LIVAALALVVLVRAVAWDEWRWFADLDAAMEVLFLPAWLVLFSAILKKRWWMAGCRRMHLRGTGDLCRSRGPGLNTHTGSSAHRADHPSL